MEKVSFFESGVKLRWSDESDGDDDDDELVRER